MKRLFLLLLITVFLFSSCNVSPDALTETSEIEITSDSISEAPETTFSLQNENTTEPAETEPEVTWYYDDYKRRRPDAFPEDTGEYPEEIKNIYLSLPSVYETTANGLDYFIEFYSDTVYMHKYLFVRITVTNNTDSSVWCAGGLRHAGFFERDDGEILVSDHNSEGFSDDTYDSFGVAAGGSRTFEVRYYINHDFFKVGHSYTYINIFSPTSLPREEFKRIEIPIPINVSN